jgi:hypothetical protein
MNWRLWVLCGVLLAAGIAVCLLPPIPQNQAYHNFADKRLLWWIPNGFDVISNVLFLITGVLGIGFVLRSPSAGGPVFLESRERWPYFLFFLCIALTTFGSAYYHLLPGDDRLALDRAPISLAFMSLTAAFVAERINVKAGLRLLVPLLLLGAGSVIYWNITQAHGQGDLRPYAFVQFGSMLALLCLWALFPPRYTRAADFLISFGFYALAKVFEATDHWVFGLGRIVSGHTLKHVFAAVSAYWILRMLALRRPIRTAND